MFSHLHAHSCYSLGDGPDSPEELCNAAARLGFQALALTDTNGLYGAVRFADAALAVGIRPILGTQLKHGRSRAVVLALDDAGLRRLLALVSALHAAGDGFDLAADKVGLTAISALGVSGEARLAEITFSASGEDGTSSALTLTADPFADPGGQAMDVTTQNGRVNISIGAEHSVFMPLLVKR